MPETNPTPNTDPVQSAPQTNPVPAPAAEVEIDGQKYSVDDVKAWKSGHMMQADYTKKTQELAKRNKELDQMEELRSYLNDNPHVARQVAEVLAGRAPSPQPAKPAAKPDVEQDDDEDDAPAAKPDPRIDALERQVRQFQIKDQLDALKTKYPDADPKAILQESMRRRSLDFDMIYHSLKGQNTNADELREQLRAEIRAELEAQNDPRTDSMVGGRSTAPAAKPNVKLSDDERKIAQIYGMSDEDYAKWKS